jgi:hypothetical protein
MEYFVTFYRFTLSYYPEMGELMAYGEFNSGLQMRWKFIVMFEFTVSSIALLAICGLFAFALHIDPVSGRWLGQADAANYRARLTECST